MGRLILEEKANIFATDLAVSVIMTAPKSQYSWDLEIKRFNGILFIDKRDNEDNILNNLTVNETSNDNQPQDDETVNGVRSLLPEAQKVNDIVTYMTKNKNKEIIEELDEEIEIDEDELENDTVISENGYLYKLWKLGENQKICIRCKVHNYIHEEAREVEGSDGETKQEVPPRKYMNVYTLNEYQLTKNQNYHEHLETMIAQILTREI